MTNHIKFSTADNANARAERLARIRARRGTPDRDATIAAIARHRAEMAAHAAEDAAWERRFNRADLRTQALMLAEENALGDEVSAMLRLCAETMPAGWRWEVQICCREDWTSSRQHVMIYL